MKRPKKKTRKDKISEKKEDIKQRKKYAKGGRIEAYTFGETSSKKGKKWPF